jgi:hypothetical protein
MNRLLFVIAAVGILGSTAVSQVQRIATSSGEKDTVIISNSIYLGTQGTGAGMDPLGGVIVFSTDNSQDGSGYFVRACNGTHYYKTKPDTVIFSAVGGNVYLFVPQEFRTTNLNGHYNVTYNRRNFILDSSMVLFLNERPEVLQIGLQTGAKDTVVVSNCIYLGSQSTGSGMDPLAGVVMFSANNLQDSTGYFDTVCNGTHYYKSKPDTVIFTSVGSALYLFVPQEGLRTNNENGAYDVYVNRVHYSINASNIIFGDALSHIVAVHGAEQSHTSEFKLWQNYPNPFNPSTRINYRLSAPGKVTIRIFDISGTLVRTILDERSNAGTYSVDWNGTDESGKMVSSGIYLCRIQTGGTVQIMKMVLLK